MFSTDRRNTDASIARPLGCGSVTHLDGSFDAYSELTKIPISCRPELAFPNDEAVFQGKLGPRRRICEDHTQSVVQDNDPDGKLLQSQFQGVKILLQFASSVAKANGGLHLRSKFSQDKEHAFIKFVVVHATNKPANCNLPRTLQQYCNGYLIKSCF